MGCLVRRSVIIRAASKHTLQTNSGLFFIQTIILPVVHSQVVI